MSAAHLIQLQHRPPPPPPPPLPPWPPLGVCAAEFHAHYHSLSASNANIVLSLPSMHYATAPSYYPPLKVTSDRWQKESIKWNADTGEERSFTLKNSFNSSGCITVKMSAPRHCCPHCAAWFVFFGVQQLICVIEHLDEIAYIIHRRGPLYNFCISW